MTPKAASVPLRAEHRAGSQGLVREPAIEVTKGPSSSTAAPCRAGLSLLGPSPAVSVVDVSISSLQTGKRQSQANA